MPSFDIVSRVDMHEVDNTINNTLKQISTRYDFRGSKTEINLDKKEKKIRIVSEDKMKMDAIKEMLLAAAAKRGLDLKVLKFGEVEPGAAGNVKREINIQEGIDQDSAKKIVKLIKDKKMKVQASIQGEEVRVSGKKIDDLQEVIAVVKAADMPMPLQYVNMKS